MLSAHPPPRTLISYDDIAPSGANSGPDSASPPPVNSGRRSTDPPSKKRKRNNAYAHSHGQHSHGQRRVQTHWDDPSPLEGGPRHVHGGTMMIAQATTTVRASGGPAVARREEDEDDEDEEEGHTLSHDEIWDDSALVDAWNAAQEEYEALNGPDKDWKNEPLHKSPLWYNNPSSSSKGKGPAKQVNAEAGPSRQTNGVPEGDATEPDSQPLDFNTFVPSHNSSLVPVQPPPASQSIPTVPGASAPIVSRDEAFQNAMSAMYWSGYWTAAYHYQSQAHPGGGQEREDEEDEEAEVEDEIEMDDGEDLISTQR